jgi:hypothetical protein
VVRLAQLTGRLRRAAARDRHFLRISDARHDFCAGLRARRRPRLRGADLQALLSRLVLPVLRARVAGSASANQTATVVGPAIGGLLYALSPTLVYALCAALFIGAAILISFIRVEQVAPKREKVDFAALFAGIAFIRKNPLILGATSLDMFAVLFAGATALLPIYAKDVFHVGPWAWPMRAMPAGALLMAIALARWPFASGRPQDVCRRRLVRHRHHDLRDLHFVSAVAGLPVHDRRRRHGERGGAADARQLQTLTRCSAASFRSMRCSSHLNQLGEFERIAGAFHRRGRRGLHRRRAT